jgi:recombination protein RecR
VSESWQPAGAATPVARLIEELHRLPGIGPKGAQRLAYHLLRASKEEAQALAEAILEVKDKISLCSLCQNTTDVDPCRTCEDPSRDRSIICVVEEPLDVLAIERTRGHKGVSARRLRIVGPGSYARKRTLREECLWTTRRTSSPGSS